MSKNTHNGITQSYVHDKQYALKIYRYNTIQTVILIPAIGCLSEQAHVTTLNQFI
jgi:hypothetical protein